MTRWYMIGDEESDVPGTMVVVSWEELAEANNADTMEEIALLAEGERTVLGMCDPIERLQDSDERPVLLG